MVLTFRQREVPTLGFSPNNCKGNFYQCAHKLTVSENILLPEFPEEAVPCHGKGVAAGLAYLDAGIECYVLMQTDVHLRRVESSVVAPTCLHRRRVYCRIYVASKSPDALYE